MPEVSDLTHTGKHKAVIAFFTWRKRAEGEA